MISERMQIARLYHRFSFGPRPGEFARALKQGLAATSVELLTVPINDEGLKSVVSPTLTDLGPFPPVNTVARKTFDDEMRRGRRDLTLWWLDRMVLSSHGLTERMTWFWHGHWATSIGKVEYALPMYLQNQTLRKNALGNFADQARNMILDGALQYWLDNGGNTISAPNENLAREFMELFTLGVDQYSEQDVKQVARALTGYAVSRSSGNVTLNLKKHDASSLTILGKSSSFTAEDVSNHLVAQTQAARFIAERVWFRFISDTAPLTSDNSLIHAFADRNISTLIKTAGTSAAMADPQNSLVKSPVEWFAAVCRALKVIPSKVSKPDYIINFLDKLGQIPFLPPNVGGWPTGEAWLTAAAAQYRLQIAQYLLTQGDVSPLTNTPSGNRYFMIGDLLGIPTWSVRTARALRNVQGDPTRMFLLAVSSPEYIVSV